MSSKTLMRLAATLGVLVVAWFVLALVRRAPNDRPQSLTWAKVDTAAIDSVVVATPRDTAVIVRQSAAAKRWTTNGFPSDSDAVANLLKGLADTARSSELVAQNTSSYARLGVSADSAAHVVVFGHGGTRSLDVITGARTPDYAGLYVRRGTDPGVYAMHGTLAEALAKPLDDWRDKRVVAVTADSVGSIDAERGGHRYTLERSGKTWRLGSGKPVDSSAVANLLGDLHDVRADGFPTRPQSDSLEFKQPKARIRFVSKSGMPIADLVFDSTAAGQWVRAASGGPVFKLDAWLWGRLAPAESTLVAKPKKT